MIENFLKNDKSNILKTTYNFPQDSKSCFDSACCMELPKSFYKVKNVFITGMGGSCISGDLLKSYLLDKSTIPIIVNRSSSLPTFVNQDSLAIFISYSGNTQETVNCAKEAIKRGCKCILLTCGGELETLSNEKNTFLYSLRVKNKMPRSAIGDMFYSLVGILKNIEKLNIDVKELEESLNSLKTLRDEIDINTNPNNWLYNLSKNLVNKNLVIFGVTPSTDTIALRWKNQFNENSKEVVLYNFFPELTHNEIVGLTSISIDNYYFLVLRDKSEDNFLKNQIEFSLEFFKDSAGLKNFYQDGNSLIERQIKLIYLGDYLSIYLALEKGIDPTPIESISILKNKMIDI